MDIYQAIEARRSVREYQNSPIPRKTLQKIIECGPKAPSGMNDQGWIFVVVDDPALKAKVAENAPYGRFILDAGACVVIFCDKEACAPVEDCSAAVQNIMLAAVAEGLGTCWVGSHQNDTSRGLEEALGCPDTHEVVALVALGLPAAVPPAPEKKAMNEVIRWNGF